MDNIENQGAAEENYTFDAIQTAAPAEGKYLQNKK